MEVQFFRILQSVCSTDVSTNYRYFHTVYYSKTVKRQIDFPFSTEYQLIFFDNYFSRRRRQLGGTKKLAALDKQNCGKHPSSTLAQNSIVLRSREHYITPVSEEIEESVRKKLSQELSRTKNCILRVLSVLDDSFKDPLIQGLSGTSRETSRNS